MKNYLNKLKKNKDDLEKRQKQSLNKITEQIKKLEGAGNTILSYSKEAINASINENLFKASKLLSKVTGEIKNFSKGLSKVRFFFGKILVDSRLKTSDFQNVYAQVETLEKDFSAAKEEFYEARILFSYLESGKNKILIFRELSSDFEIYTGALADFCGELLRKAKLDVVTKVNAEKDIKKYYQ